VDHVRRCAVSRTRHCPKIFFFFLFRFYFIKILCRILCSLSSSLSLISLGFLVHVFLSSSRLSLLSLVHTQGSPDSFALLGVHVSALLLSIPFFSPLFSHSSGSSFCSVQHFPFSSLLSRHCPSSYTLCSLSFFLLCYGTSSSPSSVSVSLLSLYFLFFFFFYLRSTTPQLSRVDDSDINPTVHCTIPMYVIVSAFGIHIDRKRVLPRLATDTVSAISIKMDSREVKFLS